MAEKRANLGASVRARLLNQTRTAGQPFEMPTSYASIAFVKRSTMAASACVPRPMSKARVCRLRSTSALATRWNPARNCSTIRSCSTSGTKAVVASNRHSGAVLLCCHASILGFQAIKHFARICETTDANVFQAPLN